MTPRWRAPVAGALVVGLAVGAGCGADSGGDADDHLGSLTECMRDAGYDAEARHDGVVVREGTEASSAQIQRALRVCVDST